jgi:hypothetical protein
LDDLERSNHHHEIMEFIETSKKRKEKTMANVSELIRTVKYKVPNQIFRGEP